MNILDECRYYAPCGLCTFYNKPCKEICGRKPKYIGANALTPTDNPPKGKIIPFIQRSNVQQ